MQAFDNIEQALRSLRTFERDKAPALSDHLKGLLDTAVMQVSIVDSIVKFGEALYANRDELDNDGRELCGQLIGFAAAMGWHGLREDNRGLAIVKAMSRDTGEEPVIGDWPDAEDDPAPKEEFVLVEATTAPDAPLGNEGPK